MASLAGFSKLRRLVLNHTAVADDGLKHLAGLTKLQDVDLFRTKVTQEGIARLQKALPETRISR